MPIIYHLTAPERWQQAQARGEYRVESLMNEGFIHASTLAQVIPVANTFYPSAPELVLLCIDCDRLDAEIRWEAPVPKSPHLAVPEGERFPHIYGAIELEAIREAIALPRDQQGAFTLPDNIPK